MRTSSSADGPGLDFDDNYSRDRGRGPQRRRHDDPPRRRYEEPPFPKLRRLLLNIASSTKLPQDEAIDIAKILGENFEDEKLRSDFFDVFIQLSVILCTFTLVKNIY
jgi:nuclear cap-binding protein subunit 1